MHSGEMEMHEQGYRVAETCFNIYTRVAGLDESMALLRECVALLRKVLGQQHPDSENIARCYAKC